MKLRYKIGGGILAVLAIAIIGLALVISQTDDCVPGPPVAAGTETMKSAVYRCYGSPDVITYEDLEKPEPGDGEVLVKIHAAGVNPYDWHHLRGSPYLMRLMIGLGKPDDIQLGADFAGVIEKVGAGVEGFAPGDRVFGGWSGAYSEYLVMPANRTLVRIPEDVSFAEAAGVPMAALTAYQALRDYGHLQPGQRVLINGASGGVGTYAVQIAKAMGAEVAGVCSTRNVELVKSLGADRVWDYKKENYTESGEQYDLILDNVGNHSISAQRGSLTADGRLVMVGGKKGDWIAPLVGLVKAAAVNPFVDQELTTMLAQFSPKDLAELAQMMEEGKLRTVIDKQFSLENAADAVRHSESGRARGKIVITME